MTWRQQPMSSGGLLKLLYVENNWLAFLEVAFWL